MKNDFRTYIKAVGSGHHTSRALENEEIDDAFEQILCGVATDAQIGAFLTGWRLQKESASELRAAWFAMQRHVSGEVLKNSLELGYPADGKSGAYLLPQILPHMGETALVACSSEPLPPKLGMTLAQLCEKESLPLRLYRHSDCMPSLAALHPLRCELGMRTALNTLEKLLHPAVSRYGVIGMHHAPYFDLYAQMYRDVYERLIIIKGDGGTPEVLKKTSIVVLDRGCEAQKISVDPEQYGVGDEASMARFNAALWRYAAKEFGSLEEAFGALL